MEYSEEVQANLAYTNTLYGLVVSILTIFLSLCIYLRETKYIIQRDLILLIVIWASSMLKETSLYFATRAAVVGSIDYWIPCEAFLWATNLPYNAWSCMVITRSVRLLLIYNISKWKLDHDNDETCKKPFWCHEKYFSTKYSLLFFLCLFSFGIFLTIPVAIYASNTTCNADILNLPAYIFVVFYQAAILVLAFQLRKVHDAYGIKKEFNFVAIYGIAFALPFGVVVFFSVWGWILGLLTTPVYEFCYLGYPVYLGLRDKFLRRYADSDSSDDKSSVKESALGDDDGAPSLEDRELLCVHPDHVHHFKNLPLLMPYIERYILHYQEVALCNKLLFVINLMKFSKLPNSEALVGKAYLICQKFVLDDSYLLVEDLDPVVKTAVVNKILAAVNSVENNWDPDAPAPTPTVVIDNQVFHELFVSVRRSLYEGLFRPFFKSEQFRDYLKATSLHKV